MVKLHQFGKKKRIHKTSIDRGHDHLLKLGKVRTRNAVYYNELDQMNGSIHHHPVSYDSLQRPMIGRVEGHDHEI